MKTLPLLVFVFSALLLANLVTYTVADEDDGDDDIDDDDNDNNFANELPDAAPAEDFKEFEPQERFYDEEDKKQLRQESDEDNDYDLEKRRWVYICEPESCVKRCLALIKTPIAKCGPDGKCYCKREKKPKSQ